MNWSTLPLSICMLTALAASAAAQTPHAVAAVGEKKETGKVEVAAASAANSWIGAQLGYKFGDNSKELGDNLLVSASLIYEIPMVTGRKFVVPVISNFSHLVADPNAASADEKNEDKLRELMLASSGVRAGVYPYRKIKITDDFELVVHGEASWKLNAFKQENVDALDYLNQFRIGGGVELAVGKVDADHKPLTLSVTPIHTRFAADEYAKIFGESRSYRTALEVVAVVPVSGRTGVLFEYVTGTVSSFRAALIVAAKK